MLVSGDDQWSDKERRKLYVGMTRAKKLLHIHYSGDSWDKFAECASAFETEVRNNLFFIFGAEIT